MNNAELDKTLRRAKVPDPRAGYWDDLPANVQREIARGASTARGEVAGRRFDAIRLVLRRAVPLTLAAACLMVGFFWGAHWRKGRAANAVEIAEARACWREAAALFPNQLQAIEFDQQGSRLVLSEQANRPIFPPVFVRLCDGKRCQGFVTFSGQQISVNGESFEVLIDRKGEILLAGNASVWNSATDTASFGRYKVMARPLAAL